MKVSIGLRNFLMLAIRDAYHTNGGVIAVYEGTIPDNPKDPPRGTLIGHLTHNGVTVAAGSAAACGLQWQAGAADGRIEKDPNAAWRMETIAAGTATYGRLQYFADDALANDTALRFDVPVGDDINMLNLDETRFTAAGQLAQVNRFIMMMAQSQVAA